MSNVTTTPTTPSIRIEQVAQIVEIMICVFLVAFYTFQRTHGKCGWQVLYVSMVTPISYILTLACPKEYVILKLESGQEFFWFRYASWYLTCPILLELLCRVVVPRKPSSDFLMRILVLDLLMTTCGVTAAVQKNIEFKMVMYSIASLILMYIYYQIYQVFQQSNHRRHGIKSGERTYRRNIIWTTFISWLIFPVVFLLGPETFNVISVEWSIVIHVVGDIIAKNGYSFVSWHFRNVYTKKSRSNQPQDEDRSGRGKGAPSISDSHTTLNTDKTPDFDTFSFKSWGSKKKKSKKAYENNSKQGKVSRSNSQSRRNSRHEDRRRSIDRYDRREENGQKYRDDISEGTEMTEDWTDAKARNGRHTTQNNFPDDNTSIGTEDLYKP